MVLLGKQVNFWASKAWIWILALPFTRGEALDKLFNLSEPQFFCLHNEKKTNPYFPGLFWELTEIAKVKF